jgi:hypothetical protein
MIASDNSNRRARQERDDNRREALAGEVVHYGQNTESVSAPFRKSE